MFYASKYVNMNRDEVEVVEVDETADLLNLPPQAPQAPTASHPPSSSSSVTAPPQLLRKPKRHVLRKANTNVVSARLGTLNEDVVVATGDPVNCKCGAVFNHLSELKEYKAVAETTTTTTTTTSTSVSEEPERFEEGDLVWTCEFCGEKKAVTLDDEERPKAESVDYILEPPTETVKGSEDDGIIIFCIDISGSMCVTTEVKGKFKLKGAESTNRLSSLNPDRVNQYGPRQNRDVTYVSRLQAVLAAVDAQLEQMEKEHPLRRVGLVTFNREVCIIGDGKQAPETVTGDKLSEYGQLLEIGAGFDLSTPIRDSRRDLSKKLFELEEMGPTALGPALVVSVGMAAKAKGSKVVICTDGCSNVGIGALDDIHTDTDRQAVEKFYDEVGTVAVNAGTTISVISIKGDACRLEELGVLADKTNGDVDIVDPLDIMKNFASILSLPVLATHVSVKLLVHRGLYLRTEDDVDDELGALERSLSSVDKEIGNVTSESEVTFEYGVKPQDILKKCGVDEKTSSLPFQMQVRYRKLNGMKCIRVISRVQPITWDAKQAEEGADVDILGLHAVTSCARMAKRGNYTKARLYNKAHMNMMQRTATTAPQQAQMAAWAPQAQMLEMTLGTATKNEISEGLDLEADDADFVSTKPTSSFLAKKKECNKARKARRNDSTANALYQMTSKSAKKYTPTSK